MDLRPYQFDALNLLREAIGGGKRRVIVMMPTGAGKTRLAAEIVNLARAKGKRVIFEVPAISLVDQTCQMFWDEGIEDIGVIQANHEMTDWSKPVQVASVQTLMRRELPSADIVIRDEAHKLFKFDIAWMTGKHGEHWRDVPFIGLTATPWTRGLGKLYEDLIVGATISELIEQGYLCSFRVFAPSHPDLKGVRIVAGDYHEVELSEAMQKNGLVADIVETWKKLAEGRPTICFAVDRAHANKLRERFEEAGVPAGYMDCTTPLAERAAVRRSFERGEIKVVCNVDVIGIGVDWPEISCISYCRPTRSEMRFVQNIGRGLRVSEGKTDLLILDHSDTHLRLGFVTDIQHEGLHNGREAPPQPARVRLPKECPSCGYLKTYGQLKCPNCGFETEPPPPVREYSAGELTEYAARGKVKERVWTLAEKAIFLAELKGYGEIKGYKSAWAAVQYKERFGAWPHYSIKDVAPIPDVTLATRNWIRSRMIAWRHSKKNPANMNGGGTLVVPRSNDTLVVPKAPAPGTLMTEDDLRFMGEDFR